MLIFAPVGHVHRGRDDGLRPLANQFVGDAPVAQVIADAQADFAPRRIPNPLLRCRQSVPEELNRHAFGLTKNDFAARSDDENGVVEAGTGNELLPACDEIFLALAAPSLDSLGNRAVEGVFAQNNQFGFRVTLQELVQSQWHFQLRRKFHLQTGDLDPHGTAGRRCSRSQLNPTAQRTERKR